MTGVTQKGTDNSTPQLSASVVQKFVLYWCALSKFTSKFSIWCEWEAFNPALGLGQSLPRLEFQHSQTLGFYRTLLGRLAQAFLQHVGYPGVCWTFVTFIPSYLLERSRMLYRCFIETDFLPLLFLPVINTSLLMIHKWIKTSSSKSDA